MIDGNTNNVNVHLGRIAKRIRDSIAQGGLDPTLDLIPERAQSRYERELAMRGWRNLRAGRSLSSEEVTALEELVLPIHRPMFDVIEDAINDAPSPWGDLWQFQTQLAQAIQAVGVLKISSGEEVLFNSTAVLVAENLLLINRHVAEQCFSGVGVTGLERMPGRSATVDFYQEIWASDPQDVKVIGAKLIHPFWDLAVLEIEPAERTPLTLWGSEPPFLQEMRVMSIGYPAMNPNADFELQGRQFKERFNIKRCLPGAVVGYREIVSYQNRTNALVFDSSSLGVNSGAAVVDLDTGKLLGVQFVNAYLDANFAVPCWELARDPWMQKLGIDFQPQPPSSTSPPWLQRWTEIGESLEEEQADPENHKPEHNLGAAIFGGDWYERCSDEDIVEALRRSPVASHNMLRAALSPQQANEVIGVLGASQDKPLEVWPSPRRELPEIVVIPDFLGCHLSHTGTALSRIWLDPQRIFSPDVARRLTLDSDGVQEVDGMSPMTVGPLLRFKYGHAIRNWRRAGFAVHPFAYDWRKSVRHSAVRLHHHLEALRLDRPHANFVLVAHGLGGLVAAAYAARFAAWRECVSSAIFLGVPLGGCLMPVEAVNGEFAVFEKLRLLSDGDKPDFVRMALSMPGLLDQLPAPRVFANAAQLYSAANWSGDAAPTQRLLQQSLNLKASVEKSPLLERVSVILSTEHGTRGTLSSRGQGFVPGPYDAPGDGVVSTNSALPEWLDAPAYSASFAHSDLLQEPAVVAAIAELLSRGQCQLPAYERRQLAGSQPLPPDPQVRLSSQRLGTLAQRLRSGLLSLHDGDWLLSHQMLAPPM